MSSLILGSSNADYHSNKSHLSSSQLKSILKDPGKYHNDYILGNKINEEKAAFSEGSFVHTLVLEPHKVNGYAVFNGLRKAGAAYEAFKAANPNKIILSIAQVNRCEALVKSYSAHTCATQLFQNGLPEHNMVGEILGVQVKARGDYVTPSADVIVDLKTSAMPTDKDIFRGTVLEYGYALSAALYCEIYRQTYGRLCDFYWVVLSKADGQCAVYKASTETLSNGAAEVTRAIVLYKKCLASGVWAHEQPKKDFNTNTYEIEEI